MMRIVETRDPALMAELNDDIQTLHHMMRPDIFKPFDKQGVHAFFVKVFEKPENKAFLAMDGETAMGYVLVMLMHNPENPFMYERKYVLIDQLLVKRESRKSGIGKMLVAQAFDYARSLQIETVELNHWTNNHEARAFFARAGFTYYQEKMSIRLDMNSNNPG